MQHISQDRPTIAIFGATGGIGRAIAAELAARQQHLCLIGRRRDALVSMQQAIPNSMILTCDVTESEQIEQVFHELQQQAIFLQGIANCVGNLLLKPAHRTTLAEWQLTLQLNLTSSFLMLRHGIPLFLEQKQGGSVLLFGSVAGQYGLSNHEAIAAAKAGVKGLILSAAATYAKQNIRINGIAPGLIRTDLTQGLLQNDISRAASEQMHPLGRIGTPQDIATLAAFLLTEQSSFVTGQMWSVDGGLSCVRSSHSKPITQQTSTPR